MVSSGVPAFPSEGNSHADELPDFGAVRRCPACRLRAGLLREQGDRQDDERQALHAHRLPLAPLGACVRCVAALPRGRPGQVRVGRSTEGRPRAVAPHETGAGSFGPVAVGRPARLDAGSGVEGRRRGAVDARDERGEGVRVSVARQLRRRRSLPGIRRRAPGNAPAAPLDRRRADRHGRGSPKTARAQKPKDW